uniref:Uncharacterized protein n=1 Tax=Arundo donax TaxID=35708 RepID=A0A0A8ZBQ8_ARUDO
MEEVSLSLSLYVGLTTVRVCWPNLIEGWAKKGLN